MLIAPILRFVFFFFVALCYRMAATMFYSINPCYVLQGRTRSRFGIHFHYKIYYRMLSIFRCLAVWFLIGYTFWKIKIKKSRHSSVVVAKVANISLNFFFLSANRNGFSLWLSVIVWNVCIVAPFLDDDTNMLTIQVEFSLIKEKTTTMKNKQWIYVMGVCVLR